MSKIFMIFIIIFFVFIGIITTDNNFSLVNCNNNKNICFYNGNDNLILDGYISSEITEKNGKKNFIFKVKNEFKNGNKNINIDLYNDKNELFYGDILKIQCSLEKPKNSANSSFNYVKYLQLKRTYSVGKNCKILAKVGVKKNFKFYIFKLKEKIKNKIYSIYKNPYNGFIFGILFGGNYLQKDISALFSDAGISHITAISGYNISIIITIITILSRKININRKYSFYIIIFVLVFFAIITGGNASVVRAVIMGICSQIATQFGRISSNLNTLFFVGFIMVLINPMILIYDVGFQLSFCATLGILIFNPILDKIIPKKINFLEIRDNFITTISASVATFPIIYLNFGKITLTGIAVNIFILFFLPYLMLFSILSIFFSFFSKISILIMDYIIFICNLFVN